MQGMPDMHKIMTKEAVAEIYWSQFYHFTRLIFAILETRSKCGDDHCEFPNSASQGTTGTSPNQAPNSRILQLPGQILDLISTTGHASAYAGFSGSFFGERLGGLKTKGTDYPIPYALPNDYLSPQAEVQLVSALSNTSWQL